MTNFVVLCTPQRKKVVCYKTKPLILRIWSGCGLQGCPMCPACRGCCGRARWRPRLQDTLQPVWVMAASRGEERKHSLLVLMVSVRPALPAFGAGLNSAYHVVLGFPIGLTLTSANISAPTLGRGVEGILHICVISSLYFPQYSPSGASQCALNWEEMSIKEAWGLDVHGEPWN